MAAAHGRGGVGSGVDSNAGDSASQQRMAVA